MSGELPAPRRRRRRRRNRIRIWQAAGANALGRLVDRLRQAVTGYYSGQLTWKMTFIGIILSTITMTTILTVFGGD